MDIALRCAATLVILPEIVVCFVVMVRAANPRRIRVILEEFPTLSP